MAQVNPEISTPMPALSTRRRFLSQAAGVAAGGTVLAVQQLCDSCWELEWALANTVPTSVAGVAALLRYANECEDQGDEWPDTDTVGSEGWHYQLRQTAARALEALLGDDRA
jgi:hypothetical protein